MISKKLRRTIARICRLHGNRMDDHLEHRALMAAMIADRAEGGQIAIVYGGIDCDGGRWDDRVELLPAIPRLVEAWIDRYNEDAEGPQWTRIRPPSEAAELEPSSRDLALEAFENGHPHLLQY